MIDEKYNALKLENVDLKRKLKAQYKRARAAEDRAEMCAASVALLKSKCDKLTERAVSAENWYHRTFVMLEHALEIKAKGI